MKEENGLGALNLLKLTATSYKCNKNAFNILCKTQADKRFRFEIP
jgi:hypothetical protein